MIRRFLSFLLVLCLLPICGYAEANSEYIAELQMLNEYMRAAGENAPVGIDEICDQIEGNGRIGEYAVEFGIYANVLRLLEAEDYSAALKDAGDLRNSVSFEKFRTYLEDGEELRTWGLYALDSVERLYSYVQGRASEARGEWKKAAQYYSTCEQFMDARDRKLFANQVTLPPTPPPTSTPTPSPEIITVQKSMAPTETTSTEGSKPSQLPNNELEYPLLQRGDKGDEVMRLQLDLIERDFLSDTADGVFGKKTENAIKLVQEQAGLPATGIADSKTQSMLMKMRRDALGEARRRGEAWSIAGDSATTMALKYDGTVVIAGGDYDLSNWHDIVQICCSPFIMGVKRDGTVVAVGSDWYADEIEEIGKWTDIVAVSGGALHVVGLKNDGTVVAMGGNEKGECNVSGWRDIVAVSANGDKNTIGLKRDGTVVAAGWNDFGKCNVSGWSDIVQISSGTYHTVGLKRDGTVVFAGLDDCGQNDVSSWENITAVAAGFDFTVGLKKDGTVVAAGENEYGQCDVSGWTDIVAITTGSFHTIGLKSDGTLVATGGDNLGRTEHLNVSGWKDIWTP